MSKKDMSNRSTEYAVTCNREVRVFVKRITLYTTIHFIIAVVFWFLLAGVALGLGFKENWSTFDYLYSFVVRWGVNVLTFPVWWLTLQELPSWSGYLLIPLQIFVSFVQVNIILFLWSLYATRNK